MKKKFPFSYRIIQQIKAEEYQRFFSRLEGYFPYLNHLGEVVFMKEAEALGQHEFFLYPETFLTRLKRKLQLRKPLDLSKLPQAERELRLQIRKYLEEKYIGHVSSETARLLPEEFEYQITPEELESIPITLEAFEATDLRRFALVFFMVIVLLVAGGVWFAKTRQLPAVGNLIVKTNVEGARVYLDDQGFVGYTGRVLPNVPAGEHIVRVAKFGYRSLPAEHKITIPADSTVTVQFKLIPTTSVVSGFLKIQAPYPDSDVYIDSIYVGRIEEHPFFEVETGQHVVTVRKEGYITIPSVKLFNITAGDTSIMVVDQIPLREVPTSNGPKPTRPIAGTLEVESDITGARIFLNGRDTGQETDYIFTNLPFGEHRIQVRKEGYRSEPPEVTVRLSPENASAEARFHLVREFEQVQITVDPPQAEIFIDGKSVGRGQFRGPLPLGKHRLSFGDVPGYRTPRPREIIVRLREPLFLDIKYFPQMRIAAEVASNGSVVEKNCTVYTGYITFATRGFSASMEAGPEIVYHPRLGDFVWKLGYAFQYREPHGSDAIKIVFRLPQEIDYEQTFTLQLEAAATQENYPFPEPQHYTEVDIRFNGQPLNPPYQPRYLEEINGLEVVEWDVTPLVKPSNNSLIISVTNRNNQFFLLKRVVISN